MTLAMTYTTTLSSSSSSEQEQIPFEEVRECFKQYEYISVESMRLIEVSGTCSRQ